MTNKHNYNINVINLSCLLFSIEKLLKSGWDNINVGYYSCTDKNLSAVDETR